MSYFMQSVQLNGISQDKRFVQDDVKVNSRLTLHLGLRWEYLVPSSDTAGTIGNVWPSLLRQAAIPPAGGTLLGNTVAANYDANLVNPYTGKPFGPGASRHRPKLWNRRS